MPETPDQPVSSEDIDGLRETIEAARVLADAPVQFWACINRAHDTVTWTGNVASCDTCGLTSEMTQRRAALVRADERRKVAEQIRQLARWQLQGGYVDLFAFLERRARPGFEHLSAPILAAVLGVLADEVQDDVLKQAKEINGG